MLRVIESQETDSDTAPRDTSIGRQLLDMGKITPQDAERVLRLQSETGMRFGEAAQKLGLIAESDIQQVLSRQFDYPYLQPGAGAYSTELVAAYDPFSPQVEIFRDVRSQLMLRWFVTGRRAIAITAVDGGDGASYVAANLAVVFSQLGERTLLIDANMRAPRQHQLFRLAARAGLSDVLAERCDLEAVTDVKLFKSLAVLGAGTPVPNSQELLNRPPFAALNQKVASEFDVTLFDTPAASAGADALAIAAAVGGVLLVARKNRTRWKSVTAACQQFQAAGATVVGTIMVDY